MGCPNHLPEHVSVNNITSPSALKESALTVVPRPNNWPAAIAAFRNNFKSLHMLRFCLRDELRFTAIWCMPIYSNGRFIKVLQDFMCSRDPIGIQLEHGILLMNSLVGKKRGLMMSQSQTNEISRKELTFVDPVGKSKNIFCSFHGKIKSPQLRIHFCFPNATDKILKICYIGPKITKK